MRRRLFLLFALMVLALDGARAQPFPSKPVRIVVGYAAGNVSDLVTRTVAEHLSRTMGQPFIVENRPGAGTSIAGAFVARAPADGYTLLSASTAHTTTISLYAGLDWHPANSFAPITMIGEAPIVILVHPSLPAKTLAEFLSYVKARPGQVNFGNGGVGSSLHLAWEMLMQTAGITMVSIPYNGSARSLAALMAGEVPMTALAIGLAKGPVQTGQVRALAVSTANRSHLMPSVPTVAESGFPDYHVSTWYAFLAPAGTPSAIVTKLNAGIGAALKQPEVEKILVNNGIQLNGSSPEDLRKFLEADVDRWARVIKRANIKVN